MTVAGAVLLDGGLTVASIETGRQHPDRGFWNRCDAILRTGGALTAEYARQRVSAILKTLGAGLANVESTQSAGQPDRRAPSQAPSPTSLAAAPTTATFLDAVAAALSRRVGHR